MPRLFHVIPRTETRVAGKRRDDWGSTEQLPSGRWRAKFTGPDGKRHKAPVTFASKGEARAWLAVQRAQIVEGDWTPETPTAKHDRQAARAATFADYGHEWIKTRTNPRGEPLRPRTTVEYQRLLDGPLSEFREMPLTAITPAKVRKWYSELLATGKKTRTSHAYALMRSILKTAVKDKLIAENPADIDGAGSVRTGREVKPPTSTELAIIQAAFPDRLGCAVHLAAWAALRYGELFELRRKDVEIDGDTVLLHVDRAMVRVPEHGYYVGQPKTKAGKRVVAMPGRLGEPILEHLDNHVPDDPEALLFPSTQGRAEHLHSGSFNRHYWYPARELAGRPDLNWHALRHYGLSRFAATGATLRETADRAGHSTLASAAVYQHSLDGRQTALARRLAEQA